MIAIFACCFIVILQRYLIRQVFMATFYVVAFLCVMLLGGRLIRYFGLAAEGGLASAFLLKLVGYNLPYFLALVLPLGFFIALMLVLGRMYADNEMTVLTAAGVSRARLSQLLLPLVAMLFVLEAVLSLVGKPWGVARADTVWQAQSVAQAFDLIKPQEFISSGNYHLYVGAVDKEAGVLHDVVIVQSEIVPRAEAVNHIDLHDEYDDAQSIVSKHSLPSDNQISHAATPTDVLIFAETATHAPSSMADNGDAMLQIDLHNGKRYALQNSLDYNMATFNDYRLAIAAKNTPQPSNRLDGKPTTELMQDLANNANQGEFGLRLALPFLMIVALAMAQTFAKAAPRQGRWLRLLPAVLAFVLAVFILLALNSAIARGRVGAWAYAWALVGLMAPFVGLDTRAFKAWWRQIKTARSG